MKITQLNLSGFSSHVQTNLAFERPLSIVVGGLNAGKTSIANSIEYALTGECGYYRKRTDNRSELISDLNDLGAMTVGLFTDKGNIRRSRTKDNTEVFEWNSAVRSNQAALEADITSAFGLSKTLISAILNTTDFFNLDVATQKELVIGLIGAEVTDKKVRALFTDEPEALNLLTGKLDSLTALENAYKYAFDRRTIVKREKDELKPPAAPEGPKPNVAAINTLLSQLETELQEAIRAKGQAEGAGGAKSLRADTVARIEALKKTPTGPLPEEIERLEKDLLKAQGSIAQVGKDYRACLDKYAEVKAKHAVAEEKATSLETFNGRCVYSDVACAADQSQFRRLKADADAKVQSLFREMETLIKERSHLAKLQDDHAVVDRLFNDVAKAKTARETYARSSKDREDLEKKLRALPADGVPVDTKDLDEKIETLRTRIMNGKGKLSIAQSWIEREQQIAGVAEKRKKNEIELRYLESLCKFLGKDGVRVQLIDERIGKFETAINAHLKGFGFDMKIQVEPWKIIARGRPIGRMSASERYRLGVAFQIAIAKMTGFNFLICDGSEILPQAEFSTLIKMLAGECQCGVQSVVIRSLQVPLKEFLEKKPSHALIEYFVVRNENGSSQVEHLF